AVPRPQQPVRRGPRFHVAHGHDGLSRRRQRPQPVRGHRWAALVEPLHPRRRERGQCPVTPSSDGQGHGASWPFLVELVPPARAFALAGLRGGLSRSPACLGCFTFSLLVHSCSLCWGPAAAPAAKALSPAKSPSRASP